MTIAWVSFFAGGTAAPDQKPVEGMLVDFVHRPASVNSYTGDTGSTYGIVVIDARFRYVPLEKLTWLRWPD